MSRGVIGMGSAFCYELRRACRSREFKVAVLVATALSLAQLVSVSVPYGLSDTWKMWREGAYGTPPSVWGSWLGATPYSIWTSLYYYLLPLLCAAPAASSLCTDMRNGFVGVVAPRSNARTYLLAKYFTVVVTSGVIVIAPQVLNLMCTALFVPVLPPDPLTNLYPIAPRSALADLFYADPLAYVAVYLVFGTLEMSALTSLPLVLARFVPHRFVALVMPFAANVLAGFLLFSLGLARYTPTDVINPSQPYPGANPIVIVALLVLSHSVLVASLVHWARGFDAL